MNWIRAKKDFKCPICQHPDWCTFAPQLKGWCCMRVQNSRPMKNGGWFHRANEEARPLPKPEPEKPSIDAAALMREWAAATPWKYICDLAAQLFVTADSLAALGIVWARQHHAFGFPMFNGNGLMVGIRLRAASGRKWSVTGGHEGVFLPDTPRQDTAYILEGPTDTAAAVSLGLYCIGRPNCRSGISHTQVTINRLRIQRCVIISDNDPPGLDPKRPYEQPGADGAVKLAKELQVPVASITLPTKDLRKFVEWGGTRAMIDMFQQRCVWRLPR